MLPAMPMARSGADLPSTSGASQPGICHQRGTTPAGQALITDRFTCRLAGSFLTRYLPPAVHGPQPGQVPILPLVSQHMVVFVQVGVCVCEDRTRKRKEISREVRLLGNFFGIRLMLIGETTENFQSEQPVARIFRQTSVEFYI